jgi:hypothetical protein
LQSLNTMKRNTGLLVGVLSASVAGAAIFFGPGLANGKPASRAAAASSEATPRDASTPTPNAEALRKSRGSLALYASADLELRAGGAFDLVVHFHGVAKNQETNLDEARLPAAVVSVNEGVASDSYGRSWSAPHAIDRVIDFAEKAVGAGRSTTARVDRIALSSWSAGGAAVKNILQRDGDRIDAALLADGVFSFWSDEKKTVVRREPLDPLIDFGRRAVLGDKLLVITHTAIPTDYPNVETCTQTILDALDLPKAPPFPATQPSGGAPTYAVDRGGFHVRGVDGTTAEDHIAQIRALDDAYGELRRRWETPR